jgi:predicted O-linked N-acetylglucosamine transferase (SPINDLY family)
LYREALAVHAEAGDLGSNLLFTLNSVPDLDAEAVTAEHLAWAARHADPLAAAQADFDNAADPERAVRIGYVSADFRRHAVACFMEPVLRHHRHERFEVYGYSNWAKPDEVTQRLRGLCDHWRDIAGVDDARAAQMVREDRIDILVDLSGHTGGNRLLLFARKPAPIQATYMGYLGGTGMAAMDLRITDAQIDPVGVAEPLYRERLLRLPHGTVCYQPPQDAPQVGALPALERGRVTFGSFNSFPKLSDAAKRAWARLLARLPGARLRVVGVPAGEACERMLKLFESEGVFADRIDVLGRLPYQAYLEQYLQTDIALDPYPYNGGTTTLESLWMGVPVITRAGRAGFSRCAASHLASVGLDDLVAGTWEEYIDIALRLAGDLPRLAGLRAGMRERMRASPLLDAAAFTRDLEALYRGAWREWCSQQSQPHA